MKFNENTLLVVLLILCIGFIICQLITTSSTENFIVLLKEKIIPKDCADFLYYNGKYYYLYRTRRMLDENNPKRFNSFQDVKNYWETTGKHCPRLPVINLVMKKKDLDPTVEYRRECNKQIAGPNYRIDNCAYYAKTLNKIRSYQKIHDDKKLKKYFDIDTCINDIINNEDPSMTEKHDIEYRNVSSNFY